MPPHGLMTPVLERPASGYVLPASERLADAVEKFAIEFDGLLRDLRGRRLTEAQSNELNQIFDSIEQIGIRAAEARRSF